MQQLHREGLVRDDVRVHDQHLEAGPVAGCKPFEHRRAAEPTVYVTPPTPIAGTCLHRVTVYVYGYGFCYLAG